MNKVTTIIRDHLYNLTVEPFGAEVYLLYADEAENWQYYINYIKNDDTDDEDPWMDELASDVDDCAKNANAATVYINKLVVILLKESPRNTSLLVHEAVHATQAILQACGIQDSNGEIDAYLTAYIFEKFNPIVENLK